MNILIIGPKLNRIFDKKLIKYMASKPNNKCKFIIYDERDRIPFLKKFLIILFNSNFIFLFKIFLYKINFFQKIINRLYSYLYRNINRQILSEINLMQEQFDVVLFIKCTGLNQEILKHKKFNNKKKFLYLFDSIYKYPLSFNFFDKFLSYSQRDCKDFGFEYLHSWSPEIKKYQSSKTFKKERVFYAGSFSFERFLKLTFFIIRNRNDFIFKIFLVNKIFKFLPYFARKLIRKYLKINLFSNQLKTELYSNLLNNSEKLLSIDSIYSGGATNRLNESYFLGKDMITNNPSLYKILPRAINLYKLCYFGKVKKFMREYNYSERQNIFDDFSDWLDYLLNICI